MQGSSRSKTKWGSAMIAAKLAKEVVVRVRKNPGTIANLTKLIAEKGLDLAAATAWVENGEAVVRFITDDNLRAMDALREREFHPEEREVIEVTVPHKPGMLRRVTEILAAEGVELDHLYATAGERDRKSLIVLSTRNNDRALVALRAAP